MVRIMNKKNIGYLIVIIFIVVVFISIMVSGGENSTEEAGADYDSAYYVEANDNIFVKFANLCDDCCYYIVDMLLGGVETIFSSFTGN